MRSNPLSGEVLYHDSVSVIGSEIHVLAEVSIERCASVFVSASEASPSGSEISLSEGFRCGHMRLQVL